MFNFTHRIKQLERLVMLISFLSLFTAIFMASQNISCSLAKDVRLRDNASKSS